MCVHLTVINVSEYQPVLMSIHPVSRPGLLIWDGPFFVPSKWPTKQQTGIAPLGRYITAHCPLMASLHNAARAIFGPSGTLKWEGLLPSVHLFVYLSAYPPSRIYYRPILPVFLHFSSSNLIHVIFVCYLLSVRNNLSSSCCYVRRLRVIHRSGSIFSTLVHTFVCSRSHFWSPPPIRLRKVRLPPLRAGPKIAAIIIDSPSSMVGLRSRPCFYDWWTSLSPSNPMLANNLTINVMISKLSRVLPRNIWLTSYFGLIQLPPTVHFVPPIGLTSWSLGLELLWPMECRSFSCFGSSLSQALSASVRSTRWFNKS